MRRQWILGALVVAVLTAAGSLYAIGWVLSKPMPAPVGEPPADLQATAITFPSQSGSVVHGWLSPGTRGGGAVLLLPGVRESRIAMRDRARMLHRAGYATLAIDFQATGESAGDAITFGWRERLDVLAAIAMLRRTLPGEPIAAIGTSLGGAAALLAAPDLQLDALVVEAVYPSFQKAVENRIRIRLGSAGAWLAPLLVLQLRPRLGVGAENLRPVDRIGLVRCPVMVIGGSTDRHTTLTDTQQLFAAARAPKELWIVDGQAHVNFHAAVPDDYQRRVLDFLTRTIRGSH